MFNNQDTDIRLYKLHGSVTWYRTEQGDYVSSNVMIKGMKVTLATGQEAIPFIVYPGKKLEYYEPTIDILVELKKQLKAVKYIFVVGYSFKDDHISKIFRYAARINHEFILFLITPSPHDIYYSALKRHKDDEIGHNFMHENFGAENFDTDIASDLKGRVIHLPYRFEILIHLLKDQYLENLRKGQQCEIQREIDLDNIVDKQIAESRWDDCLLPYIECEYIDKVEQIIEEKIGWDELLMKRNYKLGCKIIVKSLLNVLPFEPERIRWLDRLKKYIPISPENLELNIENEKVYVLFRFNGQSPLYADDAWKFYKSILEIYKNHPVFLNDEELKLKLIENGEERISKTNDYLDVWKNTTLSLDDYFNKRKATINSGKLLIVENSLHNYKNSKTIDDLDKLKHIFNEIEKEELEHSL